MLPCHVLLENLLWVIKLELELHHSVSKLQLSLVVSSPAPLSPSVRRELVFQVSPVEHLHSLFVSVLQKLYIEI